VHLPNGKGSIILKELLGPVSAGTLRHELGIIRQLTGVEGVSRLAPVTFLLTQLRWKIMAAFPWKRCAPNGWKCQRCWYRIAAGWHRCTVHRCGVVHKDINPANILLTGPEREPLLIDFDHATTFAEERPGFVHHREIAGNLAYLAPEQTGRMGRPVDQRADLYGLGATLYELITGKQPFEGGDPLQLIHDILARVPTPPRS
jgi:serine/threonine protein kinase